MSTYLKPKLVGLFTAIALFALPVATALADGSIFPDQPERSNPLNTSFNYTITSSLNGAGEVLARANNYTYRPAVVKITDQQVYMWYCAGDGHGDGIFFASSSNSGQLWSDHGEVIRSSATRSDYLDHVHACDPSVTTDGAYYYVFYTGAPDWGPGSCTGLPEGSCDNRIFVARVPVGSAAVYTSYQKLVDVGECAQPSCFQYRPFWGPGDPNGTPDYYAPVPVVRNEIGPVWRRIGIGTTGYTTQQTSYYGIGQPSALNVWAIRIWFTWETATSAAESIQWRPYQDLSNPYNLQDQATYTKRVSNRGTMSITASLLTGRAIATSQLSPGERARHRSSRA